MEPIKLSISLLIRLMELAREELANDYQIHALVEHISTIKKDWLTMQDYEKIIAILVKKP